MNSKSSSMTDTVRRVYNVVDTLFDRHALTEELRVSRSGGSTNKPLTASPAFDLSLSIAREFDRGARLKLIASPDGVAQDGTSRRWEFFFDLPKRRAKMECDWYLPWDEATDDFGVARIDASVNPFPPRDSILRQMAREGKLLHQQLIGVWNEERQRKADLPHRFRDSDEIMLEFAQRGLDVTETEAILLAECKKGDPPYWVAQTKDVVFRTRFA